MPFLGYEPPGNEGIGWLVGPIVCAIPIYVILFMMFWPR